jgi:glycolate oxidase
VTDLFEQLEAIVGPAHVRTGDAINEDDTHDEALTGGPTRPRGGGGPGGPPQVSRLLALADGARLPVVARGSGTGLSGAARPVPEGIVVAFDRMDRVLEIDTSNHVAVVQPGVTLAALDEALRPTGLVYPVYPGEMGGSLGGNVATNAGGMRAVRYGVTRHHVLGLELVLAGGQVLRTGGKYVKCSSGYDLTQLVVGSEGTLALVTEVTVKLVPRMPHTATLLAPFATLEEVAGAVGPLARSGVAPLILEYLDALAMDGVVRSAGLDLGVADDVRSRTLAYLVVVLESGNPGRVEEDAESAAAHLAGLGALDVYVLPPTAGAALVAARERVFFFAKAAGADDIVDTVVPRGEIPAFLARTAALAAEHGALVSGCGHVGDGNVHLSVFLPDPDRRRAFLREVFSAARDCGGAVSGEHGIGSDKREYFLDLEDPAKVELMRRIKVAFDPHGILGPGRIFGDRSTSAATGAETGGAIAEKAR